MLVTGLEVVCLCMHIQPMQTSCPSCALPISGVAKHRSPKVLHVSPQLVGASSQGPEVHSGEAAAASVGARCVQHCLVACDGVLALQRRLH